ncbi:YitT family protein [Sporosarcina sp. ANT_H38]|uniref:YitT family protein n=1 Tax=Sporosarcina sp. ANT_H38 TaxID=2597358 RepID=UPI0011F0C0C2|nr:YitT family protein [Sporosarcina sp. ANT_H38]KAA0965049.1 YitT family protein [Sporosarcina sp. ANT_H38]
MYILQKALTIFIGSILVAIGVNGFLVPFELLDGGAIGISLIIHYAMGVKVGFTFLIVGIPIFMLAWKYYRSFFYNGIHGMLLSSLIIDLLYPLNVVGKDLVENPLISAICGGMFIGVGVGIMLRQDISIGGTDLLAQMIARKLAINPGVMIFCVDILIVTMGSLLIPSIDLLLSYTTVLTVGITTSLIVLKSAKA